MDKYLSNTNVPQEIWYNIILYLGIDDTINLLIFFKMLGNKNPVLEYYYGFISNSLYTKILNENLLLKKILNINDNPSKIKDVKYWMKTYSDIYNLIAYSYDKNFEKRKSNILESEMFIRQLTNKNIPCNLKIIKSVCSYITRNRMDILFTKNTKELNKRIKFVIDYHF